MGATTNTITADVRSAHYLDRVQQRAFDRMIARAETPKPLREPVSVIIPNFEALDELKECLAAIERHHDLSSVEVIIVDNHSSEKTRDFLASVQEAGRATVILNDVNFGFTYAVNQGIAAAQAERDVVLLNNDAIVTAAALGTMQSVALSDPSIAVVVPQQLLLPGVACSASTHVPFAHTSFPTDVNLSVHHDNIIRVRSFHDGGELDLSFAPFFCAHLRRDALSQLGGLDAEYGRHYRSDRLYCNSVRHLLGRRVVYTPHAVVHHKLQAATKQLETNRSDEFALMFQKNQWPPTLAEQLRFRQAVWDV